MADADDQHPQHLVPDVHDHAIVADAVAPVVSQAAARESFPKATGIAASNDTGAQEMMQAAGILAM